MHDLLALGIGIFYVVIAYGKAKLSGHSPIRWAAIVAATFLATQIAVAGGIGFVLGYGMAVWGWSESLIYDYNLHITIVSLLACVFTTWLVLRPLDKVPDNSNNEPPPPTFK